MPHRQLAHVFILEEAPDPKRSAEGVALLTVCERFSVQ